MFIVADSNYVVHTELNVIIKTRDGVDLATDIYRPADPKLSTSQSR